MSLEYFQTLSFINQWHSSFISSVYIQTHHVCCAIRQDHLGHGDVNTRNRTATEFYKSIQKSTQRITHCGFNQGWVYNSVVQEQMRWCQRHQRICSCTADLYYPICAAYLTQLHRSTTTQVCCPYPGHFPISLFPPYVRYTRGHKEIDIWPNLDHAAKNKYRLAANETPQSLHLCATQELEVLDIHMHVRALCIIFQLKISQYAE